MKLDLTFRLKPERLPDMLTSGALTPEGVEEWNRTTAERLESVALRTLGDLATAGELDGLLGTPDVLDARLNEALSAASPEIELLSLRLRSLTLPDLTLYAEARRLHVDTLEAQEIARLETARNVEEAVAVNERRLRVLEDYGRVLTEYPILIQVLSSDLDGDLQGIPVEDLLPVAPDS